MYDFDFDGVFDRDGLGSKKVRTNTRVGDFCTGHDDSPDYPGKYYPRRAIQGSITVTLDGLPIVRETDLWEAHHRDDQTHKESHTSTAISSCYVYVEGKRVIREKDDLFCGSKVAKSTSRGGSYG